MRQPAVAAKADDGTRDHEPGKLKLWPSSGAHEQGHADGIGEGTACRSLLLSLPGQPWDDLPDARGEDRSPLLWAGPER